MKWLNNPQIKNEISSLIEEYRDSCLWSQKKDFQPETLDEVLYTLKTIRNHGDRSAFIRVQKVIQWLSQQFKVPSAN